MKLQAMAAALLTISALALAGCSGFDGSKSGTTKNSTIAAPQQPLGTPIDPGAVPVTIVDPSTSTKAQPSVGLVRQSQLFFALKRCLELPDTAISAQSKSTYASVKSNLSSEGKLHDLNAPMLMSVTQIAAELCNDRIALEAGKASRNFFQPFKLAPTDTIGGTITQSIEKLTNSCWGRAVKGPEVQVIAGDFQGSSVGAKADKTAALFLCTLVLSSPEVIVY
jgi:hypothetical protein